MTRVYDLVMTHQLDADDYFIHCVQHQCSGKGLNFFLIEPLWVEAFLAHLAEGRVWARALLNMHSEHHQPEDTYHRLVRLAHEKGTRVIDPPEIAQAAFDKARLHPRLVSEGFRVPFTRIVPRDRVAGLTLSDSERKALGTPFVIKPAMGYGRRGVLMDATGERDVDRCANAWRDANYLLQEKIVPRMVHGEPAYFRTFFAFGAIWCCWWNCFTDRYRSVTPAEEVALGLVPLREIIGRLAAMTGMRFFSSEIALTDAGEFVLIDYVNDQCHMLSQGADPQKGVPDDVVAAIAGRLVEGAQAWLTASP